MNLATAKDWLTIAAILAGWAWAVFSFTNRQSKNRATQVRKEFTQQIDGIGVKVNAHEVSLAQHEVALDRQDREQLLGNAERKVLMREASEAKAEFKETRLAAEARNSKLDDTLTKILVEIGQLSMQIRTLTDKKT